MHGVGFDAFGQFLADRAGFCIFGVCRAHDVAVALHGVFAFKHLNDHWPADHEFDEFAKERAFFVHGVKAFGLCTRHVNAF